MSVQKVLRRLKLTLFFALSIFRRKPAVVKFEVQWEKIPYTFHCAWFEPSVGEKDRSSSTVTWREYRKLRPSQGPAAENDVP